MRCLVLRRDNLTIPIQMEFSQFFAAFLKSRLNFKHLSSSLVTGNEFLFGKASISDMPNLGDTLATDEKYLVLNRDNLMIPIQMQLSQKKHFFSQFFPAFLKSRLNFEYFEKKDHPHSFCISEITTFKTCLNKSLKRPVSEDASRSNMVNVPKHC